MKSIAIVGAFAVLLGLAPTSRAAGRHNHSNLIDARSRYIVEFKGEQASKVRNAARVFAQLGLDVAGVNYRKRQVELILTPAEAQVLRTRHKIEAVRIPGEATATIDPRYLTPAEIVDKMKTLAERYPKFARLHEIGRSTENRPIVALEITSPDPGLKPNVLFDGMHHAREIMTPEIPLDFAESLLQSSTEGLRARRGRESLELLSRVRLWIVPQVNPDGNNIVWTKNNWWRKNTYVQNGSVVGVDINRNYEFQWGKCNGSSGSGPNDTYRGPSPASEPETQAVIRLANLIRPIGYLSYHSFGELVLSPYGCVGQYTGENELLTLFGEKLAKALPSDSGRGNYTYGLTWQVLYAVDGGSKDYIFSQFGAPSYTIEVNEDFQPDYSLREPTVLKHRVAAKQFIEGLLTNLLTVRVLSSNGKPLSARVEFAQVPHKYGERPFMTDESGHFFKVLAPGNYTLRVSVAGAGAQEKSFMLAGQPSTLEFTF